MGRLSDFFRFASKSSDSHEQPPPYSGPPESTEAKEKVDVKHDESQTASTQRPLGLASSPAPIEPSPPTPIEPSPPTPSEPDVTIKFEIGPDKKEYFFSKARLCEESTLLRNYFRPGEPGAEITSFAEADHKPRAFEVIKHWFDTQMLPEHWYEGYCKFQAAENIAVLYQTAFCLNFTSLTNDIVDATRDLFITKDWTVLPSQLKNLQKMDMEKTLLFQLYVQCFVFDLVKNPNHWQVEDEQKKAELKALQKDLELTNTVMKWLLKWQLKPWGNPRTPAGCYYHDHSNGCKKMNKSTTTTNGTTKRR